MSESKRPWKFPLTVEYDNDTGPCDEGFWEWWEIREADGNTIAKFSDKLDAHRVLSVLNSRDLAVEAMEEMLTLFGGYPEFVPASPSALRVKPAITKLRTALAELREVGHE